MACIPELYLLARWVIKECINSNCRELLCTYLLCLTVVEVKFWTVNGAQHTQLHVGHKEAFSVQNFYWSELGWFALLTVLLKKIVKISCDVGSWTRSFLSAAADLKHLCCCLHPFLCPSSMIDKDNCYILVSKLRSNPVNSVEQFAS